MHMGSCPSHVTVLAQQPCPLLLLLMGRPQPLLGEAAPGILAGLGVSLGEEMLGSGDEPWEQSVHQVGSKGKPGFGAQGSGAQH